MPGSGLKVTKMWGGTVGGLDWQQGGALSEIKSDVLSFLAEDYFIKQSYLLRGAKDRW